MFTKKNYRVNITNLNTTIEVPAGTLLYKVLVDNKIINDTLCRGNGQCGKCKVRYVHADSAKPTKAEKLAIADINRDTGYRLSCQHSVRSDITIDTSEAILREDTEVGHIKRYKGENHHESNAAEAVAEVEPVETTEQDISSALSGVDMSDVLQPLPDAPKQCDAILIVKQTENSIRYFHYSAVMSNIIADDVAETDESLRYIVENGLIPDFVFNVLNIRDVERIIVLSDEYISEGELLPPLVAFKSSEYGETMCEVLCPFDNTPNARRDMKRYLRLLNYNANNSLILMPDMFDKFYFYREGNIAEMCLSHIIDQPFNIEHLEIKGDNPVVSMDAHANVSLLNEHATPDGIPLNIILKTTHFLAKENILDENYRLRAKRDLADNLPLELFVKLSYRNGKRGFYLLRNKDAELFIPETTFLKIMEAKIILKHILKYTENNFGKVQSIVVHTSKRVDNYVEHLNKLSIIPKEFRGKIKYHSEKPSTYALKLFNEGSVLELTTKKLKIGRSVHLDENAELQDELSAHHSAHHPSDD